jgi:general stress protein CsbA
MIIMIFYAKRCFPFVIIIFLVMIYYVKANSYILSRALIFQPIKHCFTECEHIEVDDEQPE